MAGRAHVLPTTIVTLRVEGIETLNMSSTAACDAKGVQADVVGYKTLRTDEFSPETEERIRRLAAAAATLYSVAHHESEDDGGVLTHQPDHATEELVRDARVIENWSKASARADDGALAKASLLDQIVELRSRVSEQTRLRERVELDLADIEDEEQVREASTEDCENFEAIFNFPRSRLAEYRATLQAKAVDYRRRTFKATEECQGFDVAKHGHDALVARRAFADRLIEEHRELQVQEKRYHGLSTDSTAAVEQVRESRAKLATLQEQFETMVGNLDL